MNNLFLNDDNFFKSHVLDDRGNLLKAKKMPIGTVSKGYKKIAEGKWVPIKDRKENDKKSEEIKKRLNFLKEKGFTKLINDKGNFFIYNKNKNEKWPIAKKDYDKYKKAIYEVFEEN